MRIDQHQLPFRGTLVWLTNEQGGRQSGPPPTPAGSVYAATAYVPPATCRTGLASFLIDADDRSVWRSPARAGWLVSAAVEAKVVPGTVVMVTEGPRDIAYLHVESVE